MRPRTTTSLLPIALVLGMLAALVALAGLQYRWIARVSAAEQERLKTTLDAAAERFCTDVDRELARVQQGFQSKDDVQEADLPGDLAERLARWRATAPAPKLVRELLVVTRFGRGEIAVQRLDETSRRLVDVAHESGIESVREAFEARGKVPPLDERLPGVILSVRPARPPRGEDDGRTPPPRDNEPGGERRPPRQHVVVRLDREFLQKELLAGRAEREFGGPDGLAYAVTVAVAGRPDDVLFEGGPRGAARAGQPDDAVRRFFTLHRPGDEPEPGKWILSVRHPAGSLEEAVAGARSRNLAVSAAILTLLAATLVVLVATTRRAQRLARQQMEFVAGVSHELKTPLTAMRSAGQNLADGIVDSPEKVRKYGALIEREGRRLTEMVGRVLTFAGIRSGVQTFRTEAVDVAALVDGVLAEHCRWVLEEKRVTVEKAVADGLPPVRGDAAALRQALANLVDNALKYGGTAAWVGVTAKSMTTLQGEEVVVSVADRGIGIRRSDLPRLFEPFFRSADASAAGITGSGLGLAVVRHIVEAHGGRVTVDSAPGKGSVFAIHLPAETGAGADA